MDSPAAADETLSRILVADDNAQTRDYLHLLLSERFQVRTVTDGIDAAAAAASWLPDLVIADCTLPGCDGFELSRRLRADPLTSGIPIILVSARVEDEGVAPDAEAFLLKPFQPAELLACISRELRRPRDKG